MLQLYPLSCEELGSTLDTFLQAHGLGEVMARGFYPSLWDEPDLPSLDFHRSYEAHRPESQLWFYRDRDGLEVDFVLQDGERFQLLDAKRAELPDERDAKALLAAQKVLGAKRVSSLALVTPTRSDFPLSKEVRVASGWALNTFLLA